MMPTERFERQLPALLTELAEPRTPDYLDDLLRQTATTGQRPAWSFLERWLPVLDLDIARQPVVSSPVPWRTIGLGFALMALLVAMVAVIAIGAPADPPPPFGQARNGLVAFARGGDIVAVDAVTGDSTALVTGPETDLNPRWSLDGTRIAFERKADGDRGAGLLYVVDANGTGLTRLTPEPLPGIESYSFSPDGTQVLISAWPGNAPGIVVAATDGSQVRQLELPGPATNAAWRPPDGSEILFMERGDYVIGFGGIFAIDVASGAIRTVLEADPVRHRAWARWSPDGSQIAYTEWVDAGTLTAQVHIMSADGRDDRLLPMPPDAVWQMSPAWSNDGTKLLVIRGYSGGYEEGVAVAVPVDGSSPGVEIDFPGVINAECCSTWEWAPDDSMILGTPTDVTGRRLEQVLLDPVAGSYRILPWTTTSYPSWQRLAE
jgi:Tol biopolymer transport system component